MHMEHLNKTAKGAIGFLGSNKAKKPSHESASQLELCPLYWIILMKIITFKRNQEHKRDQQLTRI